MVLLTLGHSNRTAEQFEALLAAAGVEVLVDVRAHPRSRRHPQFDRRSLEALCAGRGIRYRWEGRALGGFRDADEAAAAEHPALPDLRSRAYAAHLGSAAYRAAEDRLIALGRNASTAIMCAEADPSTCHRRFIADSLDVRGVRVHHWLDCDDARRHRRSDALRLRGDRLVYDGNTQAGLDL